MDFNGKSVLVTGASRGIGKAIALQFAQHNARIAVHYHRNDAAAHETLDALHGDGHMLVQADIGDPVAVRNMVEWVVSQMNGLDILVNNAGVFIEHPIADVNYAQWQQHWQETIQTNLLGIANSMYCAAHQMMKNGGGRIINISSRGAFRGEPTAPAYGASKAGLNALSQSMAVALAPHNIYVMTVAPGWVETDMAGHELSRIDGGDSIKNQSPLKRIATPDEVASAVLYFASEEAKFATGAILDVNGASYLRT